MNMRFPAHTLIVLLAILIFPPAVAGDEAPVQPEWVQSALQSHPLDLEARSLLAVRAMQNTIDPERGVPWIMAYLTPAFRFDVPTCMLAGEYLDGLTMAKIITGSNVGDKAADTMRYAVMHALVDGLSNGTIEGAFSMKAEKSTVELAGHKHLLPSLLTLYRLDSSDRKPLDLVQQSLETFNRIAKRGQLADGRTYLYYPVVPSVPDLGMFSFVAYDRKRGWEGRTREPIDTGSAAFAGAVTLPFAQYYQLTKDPEAAEFLDQFIRFIRERATDYNADGSFTKRDPTNGQVWSRLMTNEGILIYGLASGNQELVNWSRSVFDQLQKLHGTQFGWIPENLNFNHGLGCETDSITAYLETAFLLARFVDDSYWDSAERIAMNQLLEQQIVEPDTLGDAGAIFGGFASFGGPNDWFVSEGPYLTQSCHGSGMRSLYNVWYHAACWEEGPDVPMLRVNLHWSKRLPDAQIISHLPASTTLEIEADRPCAIVVRQPDWADIASTRIEATDDGGHTRQVDANLDGRWLKLGRFDRPAHVVISYPDEVTIREDFIRDYRSNSDVKFTTRWRGNMVLDIDPLGARRPNYVRRTQPDVGRYLARHVADTEFDPISMTPPRSTTTPRPTDTPQGFQAVSTGQ